ncbi:MAG: hypothetical protein K0R17_2089 [Rariglobus sp.]|jgi:hypothetical protein|nr:hypothetical protein [Rariglobus sp.]
MKTKTLIPVLAALPLLFSSALCAQTALTIYNQNFAVVRETVPLELAKGINAVTFDQATLHVEPDSVVLRDPSGKIALRILEQSYRADTASQGLMLSLFEGKELDFIVRDRENKEQIVRGKVIRSGYTPNVAAAQRYGNQFYQRQMAMGNWQQGAGGGPIIEIDGKLRFSLPGEPIFPSLADDTVLRPTLSWQLASDRAAKVNAELGYVTGGMSWESAYNLVSPEKGDTLDIVGWVTIDNQSGKTFTEARVKLMAGDVSKLVPANEVKASAGYAMRSHDADFSASVTEKAFDEFHLYSLPRPVTLRNRETKQVEFLRATGVKATTIYIYNGVDLGNSRYRGWNEESIRNNRDYGTVSNPKVWVYREFKNTKENGLGLPLPKGRTRFYRQDNADGAIEFTGENTVDHTAEGETVRIYTGDAFDIVGERRRTDYKLSNRNDEVEEAFEIKVRNRKKEPVEVRVTERMYRWFNWAMVENSDPFVKTDDRNVEFRVTLKPDEEKIITYRVRYDWK